jgi:hypothetical protein
MEEAGQHAAAGSCANDCDFGRHLWVSASTVWVDGVVAIDSDEKDLWTLILILSTACFARKLIYVQAQAS